MTMTDEISHPTRQHLEERKREGITPDEPQHVISAVFDPEDDRGYVYTYGVASTHPSNVEFICLDCPRDDAEKAARTMNFLAQRLIDGHEVYADQTAHSCGIHWSILGVPEHLNALLLESNATACDEDTTLLLLMPSDQLPFTLAFGVAMEADKPSFPLPKVVDSRSFYAPAA